MTALTGGCACGQVRFTATGAPRFAIICQCRACQHLTGSTHAAQFGHAADAFAVTGNPNHWKRATDSGSTVRHYFCPTCGSPVFGAPQRMPDIVMVMAGALDDPSTITPTMLVYRDERIPWDHARVEADG